jgi:hypothetical protein
MKDNNHNLDTPVVPESQDIQSAQAQASSENPNWLKRNLFNISVGAFVGGVAVEAVIDPLSKIEHEVIHLIPSLGGLAITEGAWIGGAAIMLDSAGKKIGNPLTLKSRWKDVSSNIVNSKKFEQGLKINTVGAYGSAGVVAASALAFLPPETWPGALGAAAVDVAATKVARTGLYSSIKRNKSLEGEAKPNISVRQAKATDIERLADLDLLLFDKAYGTKKPQKQEVVEGFTKRLNNAKGWMFVAEVNGAIEGFVTGFRTSQPIEEFESWENCTANGTLDGKVDPKGKYVYVANLTVKHEAVELGAEDMLLANLFANGIRDGIEYGYFISRMPHFKRWLESQGVPNHEGDTNKLAENYLNLRQSNGKRYDPQLRGYENYGYKMKQMVANAFDDDASLNYGVLFQADVPPSGVLKKIKPIRSLMATGLRQAAKSPKLLTKCF